MKGKRLVAFVLAFILAFPAAWGTPSMALETQAEEMQELKIQNLRNEEQEISWIFTEETYTFSLNTDGLENISQVGWEITLYQDGEAVGIHQLDVPEEEIYFIDPENYTITLYGQGLSQITEYMRDDNHWFDLGVGVSYGEDEYLEQWIGIYFAQEEYEVFYLTGQAEDHMLPNEDKYLHNEVELWIWNQEYPYEEYCARPITDMQILSQYYWGENGERIPTEEEVFYLVGNTEDAWNLHSNDHGSADMRACYVDIDGEEAYYDFTIYSVGDIYYLEVFFENDINNILVNDESVIDTRVMKKYQDHEGMNHYDVEVEDYFLEISNEYDTNAANITISDDGKQIYFEGGAQEAYLPIDLNAYTMDGEEQIHLAGIWFELYVLYEFYNIQPTSFENPGFGETLDLDEMAVYVYNVENPDGKKVDKESAYLYVTDFDGNVWEPQADLEKDPLPDFSRTSFDGGHIQIAADVLFEDGWYEVARRYFWFDGLDYSVWLDDLQNGDHGWVYADDEVTFHLNTEHLEDKKDYEVIFELGLHQEDTQEFVPFENQEGLFETITEAGKVTGIKIQGSVMKEMEDSLAEGGWFWVRVTVNAANQEVYSEWRGVELRENQIDYHHNEWGFGMLPYWDHGIGKNFGYYRCDAEHPDGYDGELQYTDIQIEIVEGAEDALVADEWEDGTGWNLHANSYGHAVVTLSYEDALHPGETLQHSFDVWIGQDVWNINLKTSTGTSDIIPGTTMDVTAFIEHYCYNEEDGHFDGVTEPLYYEWGYVDGSNQELFDYVTDGNVVHISAREDAGYDERAGLYLRLYLLDEDGNIAKDEDGNDIEVCYTDMWFDIREAYFAIFPLEMEEPFELGETMEISPILRFVNEFENFERMDGTVFEWEWDSEAVEIKDSEGNVLIPNEYGRSEFGTGTYTLKKLASWDTNLWLRAYIQEEGEYREMSCRNYYFSGINYDSWFEKDHGEEGYTFLFADEEKYQVTLNTDNLRDENGNLKENVSIEWVVCKVDEFENIEKTAANGVEYTVSEDGTAIYLNGKVLQENGFSERGRIFADVKMNGISVQEQPYSLGFWILENSIELQDDQEPNTVLAEGAGWGYSSEGIWVHVRNAAYPNGEDLLCEIREIRVRSIDDNEDEIFAVHENEDSWFVEALRYGVGEIEYTLYHESMGEFTVVREKAVSDEIYRMDVYTDSHTLGMLPNSEMNLIVDVKQITVDQEGNVTEIIIPKDCYELTLNYDWTLIQIDEDGKITSFDQFGGTGVDINAKITMLNGIDDYYLNSGTQIFVSDYDMKIYGEDRNVNVEDTIYVKDLGIQMIEISLDNPEGNRYEPELIEITEQYWLQISDDGKSFTIKEDALGDEFPIYMRLHYRGLYDGMEYYDWITITIEKDVKVPTTPVTEVFPDVAKGSWYESSVQYVYDNGIMSGSGGLFSPDNSVTRAMVVETLYKMTGKPAVTDFSLYEQFSDLKHGAWWENSVAWAMNEGIATGDDYFKLFNPETPVTREQLATFVYRYAKKMGQDVSELADISGMVNANNVGTYAEVPMKWAVARGIISGVQMKDESGNTIYDLNPKGTATRAQLAVILQRFCEE